MVEGAEGLSVGYKITYTSRGPVVEDAGGLFLTMRLMWRELLSARELIWRLFLRDFFARYRQSAIGIAWAVLMPIITVGMFVGMNSAGILSIGDVGIPYPLYALIGLTVWNVFTVGATASSGALVNAGAMVVKINFPKISLVFAAMGQSIVETIIRMALIALVFVYYGIAPSWGGLVIGLICIVPMYLLTTGVGFILSLATGVLRDIPNILNVALIMAMMLTPVVYPIRGDSLLARVNVWNPFNYLVNVPRDFIVRGQTESLGGFAVMAILSLVVFYAGWRVFYLAQAKIAERI
ncbi:MAG: ABC transporter permease [Deltaproteobacteria bacterium]|nr:ABC transporter permease [Deltaproteobacteria bacterium]